MLKASLYNPLLRDVTIKYDINGDGNPQEFTIKGLEISEFVLPVARNMVDYLAHAVLNQRGVKTNPLADLDKIKEEIIVSWPQEETLKEV